MLDVTSNEDVGVGLLVRRVDDLLKVLGWIYPR